LVDHAPDFAEATTDERLRIADEALWARDCGTAGFGAQNRDISERGQTLQCVLKRNQAARRDALENSAGLGTLVPRVQEVVNDEPVEINFRRNALKII
jgi:hypothetical protein